MKRTVIGQTGSGKIALSDESIAYKMSQKRTARYRYERCGSGWIAVVIGPFHSRLYGANSYGTKRSVALDALKRSLANNYSYIGRLMLSAIDDADDIGRCDQRLLDVNVSARPKTKHELCGASGQ